MYPYPVHVSRLLARCPCEGCMRCAEPFCDRPLEKQHCRPRGDCVTRQQSTRRPRVGLGPTSSTRFDDQGTKRGVNSTDLASSVLEIPFPCFHRSKNILQRAAEVKEEGRRMEDTLTSQASGRPEKPRGTWISAGRRPSARSVAVSKPALVPLVSGGRGGRRSPGFAGSRTTHVNCEKRTSLMVL